MVSYRTWLDKFPNLLSTVVYTYLRVIVDHNGQVFVNLRQKEVELCISILREKVQKTFCCSCNLSNTNLIKHITQVADSFHGWGGDSMVNQLYLIVFKENMCEINCIFQFQNKKLVLGHPRKFCLSNGVITCKPWFISFSVVWFSGQTAKQ